MHKRRLAKLGIAAILAAGLGLLSVGAGGATAYPPPDSSYQCAFDGVVFTSSVHSLDTDTTYFNNPEEGAYNWTHPTDPVTPAEIKAIDDKDDGTYDLYATATCTHVDTDDGNLVSSPGPDAVDFQSAGNYSNMVCGTMTMASIPAGSWIATDDAYFEGPIQNLDFTATTAGGVGVLEIRSATNSDGETGGGTGTFQISPNTDDQYGSNCFDVDVREFFITGTFELRLDQP